MLSRRRSPVVHNIQASPLFQDLLEIGEIGCAGECSCRRRLWLFVTRYACTRCQGRLDGLSVQRRNLPSYCKTAKFTNPSAYSARPHPFRDRRRLSIAWNHAQHALDLMVSRGDWNNCIDLCIKTILRLTGSYREIWYFAIGWPFAPNWSSWYLARVLIIAIM